MDARAEENELSDRRPKFVLDLKCPSPFILKIKSFERGKEWI